MKEIYNNSGIFQTDKNDQDIYVCGDIHGDYQCLIHCLVDLCKVCEITKIYDDKEYDYKSREYLKWIPKTNSVVIFSGDLIHRKRYEDHVLDDECSDIYIITNILRLKKEANKYGGDIIIISGNHEIMNIVQPDEDVYTSEKNIQTNIKFFSNKNRVNEYILNSYAWIKLDDILIAHGGLCSDYLSYIDNSISNKNMSGDEIVAYVNNKYREYFNNYDNDTQKEDMDGYNLFIEYDFNNKKKHNMFWCREWGYAGINCDNYEKILKQINCRKMIIAHCPQFLSPDKPKMINFECKSKDANTDVYNLARIDLGMSRSFEYNQKNNFIYYLSNNYHRKMAVLKLLKSPDGKKLYFNNSSIITNQLSCIQYLLLKFGFKLTDWVDKNITSDWIGFEYINKIIDKLVDTNNIMNLQTAGNLNSNSTNIKSKKASDELYSQTYKCVDMSNNINNKYINKNEEETILMCTLYPIIKINPQRIDSINQHSKLY
jgi:hypothetical protein